MKVPTSVLLFFAIIYPTWTYNPEVLDYVLSSIEYLADVHTGVFSCVFFDVALDPPSKSSLLEAILKSPRLDRHVTKYILNGTYHEGLEKLPRNPSVILISFGNDVDRIASALHSLNLFDPTTKILIFTNLNDKFLLNHALIGISLMQFTYSVFLDSSTMAFLHCNGFNCVSWSQLPQPILLFVEQ